MGKNNRISDVYEIIAYASFTYIRPTFALPILAINPNANAHFVQNIDLSGAVSSFSQIICPTSSITKLKEHRSVKVGNDEVHVVLSPYDGKIIVGTRKQISTTVGEWLRKPELFPTPIIRYGFATFVGNERDALEAAQDALIEKRKSVGNLAARNWFLNTFVVGRIQKLLIRHCLDLGIKAREIENFMHRLSVKIDSESTVLKIPNSLRSIPGFNSSLLYRELTDILDIIGSKQISTYWTFEDNEGSAYIRTGGDDHHDPINSAEKWLAKGDKLFSGADYYAALECYERALKIYERNIGLFAVDTADCVSQIAKTLRMTGNFEKSIAYYRRALRVIESTFGLKDVRTAGIIACLAAVLKDSGNYTESFELYERALAIFSSGRGPKHPERVRVLIDFADALLDGGEYKRALEVSEDALAFTEVALGPEHPDTALALGGLAEVCQVTGNIERAVKACERAIAIIEKIHGSKHPNLINLLINLAHALQLAVQFDRALMLCERAVEIAEHALGSEHPGTAKALVNLATALLNVGQAGQAVAIGERAVAITRKTLGSMHPDTATALVGLGTAHRMDGDFGRARVLYDQAGEILNKSLGGEHFLTTKVSQLLIDIAKRAPFSSGRG